MRSSSGSFERVFEELTNRTICFLLSEMIINQPNKPFFFKRFFLMNCNRVLRLSRMQSSTSTRPTSELADAQIPIPITRCVLKLLTWWRCVLWLWLAICAYGCDLFCSRGCGCDLVPY
jgi:hypothetical protein